MHIKTRNAFTMLELTFVIVIIGILSAVAIPKLAVTRDDAVITKARATVSAVRNAIATERQKRILRGDFTPIKRLSVNRGYGKRQIFDGFDGNASNPVLEYPLKPCATSSGTSKGCWQEYSRTVNQFVYWFPTHDYVYFNLSNNKFDCVGSSAAKKKLCVLLTQ